MKEQIKMLITEYSARVAKLEDSKLDWINKGHWTRVFEIEKRIDELEDVILDLQELAK